MSLLNSLRAFVVCSFDIKQETLDAVLSIKPQIESEECFLFLFCF